ncbi:hypothetical protein [Geopseudomonas aromaticivorans]
MSAWAGGPDAAYRRVYLEHGIELDLPAHWTVLSASTRKNLSAAGEAMAASAGIEGLPEGKKTLLAVNATPSPTGAMIRVSVTVPAPYTQADVAAVTADDLDFIRSELVKGFRQMEGSGGPRLISAAPVRRGMLGGYRSIEIPYVRAGLKDPGEWQVTQYKVPIDNRLVEITLSHRVSDAVVWKPILEHVKSSIQFY